jgi:hypothetical protein
VESAADCGFRIVTASLRARQGLGMPKKARVLFRQMLVEIDLSKVHFLRQVTGLECQGGRSACANLSKLPTRFVLCSLGLCRPRATAATPLQRRCNAAFARLPHARAWISLRQQVY